MSDHRQTDPPADQGRTAPAHAAPAHAVGAQGDVARHDTADRDLVAREKAEFGGMHFFLAFLGWLAATGAVVLLTALVTGILAATGVQDQAGRSQDEGTLRAAGVLGIVILAFVLFVGYYIGGYVAGRMARFSGLKQGLAVWLWAVLIAIVVAIIGAVASSSTGALSQLSTSGLQLGGGATATGIASIAVAVVFSLVGALVGGLGGMRFHRKVDRFARDAR